MRTVIAVQMHGRNPHMLSRHEFLRNAAVGSAALAPSPALGDTDKPGRPNIILFLSDDHGQVRPSWTFWGPSWVLPRA